MIGWNCAGEWLQTFDGKFGQLQLHCHFGAGVGEKGFGGFDVVSSDDVVACGDVRVVGHWTGNCLGDGEWYIDLVM